MSYTLSKTEQKQYKFKTNKDRKKLRKAAKQKYVYVRDEEVKVGSKLYLNGNYYRTIISIRHQLYLLQNELKPMRIPDPFLKENFKKKGFTVVNE